MRYTILYGHEDIRYFHHCVIVQIVELPDSTYVKSVMYTVAMLHKSNCAIETNRNREGLRIARKYKATLANSGNDCMANYSQWNYSS